MANQVEHPLMRLAQTWIDAPKEAKNRAMRDAELSLERVKDEADEDYLHRVYVLFAKAGKLQQLHQSLQQSGLLPGDETQFYNWPYLTGLGQHATNAADSLKALQEKPTDASNGPNNPDDVSRPKEQRPSPERSGSNEPNRQPFMGGGPQGQQQPSGF